MADPVSGVAARRQFWGAAFGGVAIAGGAAFMVFTGERPIMWLPNGTMIYVLVGFPTALLICLALRIWRGAYSAPPASAFAKSAAIACGISLFAFLPATLILLTAWLTALALGAEIGFALLQALINILVLCVVTRMLCLCIVNLAIAIQRPPEGSRVS